MVKAGLRAAETFAHGATMEAVTKTVAALSCDATRTGDSNLMPGVEQQEVRRKAVQRAASAMRQRSMLNLHLVVVIIERHYTECVTPSTASGAGVGSCEA